MPAKKRTPSRSKTGKKEEPPVGRDRLIICVRAALDKKAEELVALDIRNLSGFADYFVICHGVGELQVRAIAENVIVQLKKVGVRILGDEGMTEGKWVLVDCGDVVVHVFEESVRGFYDLERLWIHAEEVELPEEL